VTTSLLEERLERSIANPPAAPAKATVDVAFDDLALDSRGDYAEACGRLLVQLQWARRTIEDLNKEPLSKGAHLRANLRIAEIDKAINGMVKR
jgi:hypothetical protein